MTCTPSGRQLWYLTLLLPGFACGARDVAPDHSTTVATHEGPAYPFEPAPTQPAAATSSPATPLPMAAASTGTAPAINSQPPPDVIEPDFVLDVPALEPGCFDPADVSPCSGAQHPPAQPVELLTVQQLGAGYVFTALSGGVALARNGDDWRAVLFGPREELRIVVLKPPEVDAEFEVLAVSREFDRAWALAEVGGKLTLLGFATAEREPMLKELTLSNVDAQLQGLTHLDGQLCLYGEGVHCFDEQRSSWTTTLPDEQVLDIDGSLLVTESGQVYLLRWRDDARVWEPAPRLPSSDSATPPTPPTPVRYQRVNSWAAFNTEGYLLHTFGDAWLQCQQRPAGLGGSTDGFWIDVSGSVYIPTYSATRQRCKTSLELTDFIDDDDQTCGLSPNWIVLTKTTLWSITGALRCAIG